MKKLLLLPTALFPYIVCLLIAGMFGGGESAFRTLGIACLVCLGLAFVCNILFMAVSRNQAARSLLKTALILKAIHIPSYVLIFGLGLGSGISIIMTFPLVLFLVLMDSVTLFLSGMVSVYALVRNVQNQKVLSVVGLICQFFFCADVISLFVLNMNAKREGIEYETT